MNRDVTTGKSIGHLLTWLSLCTLLVGGFIVIKPLYGGTFPGNQLYVSPTGDDSVGRKANDINNPWRTVDKAMQEAIAGDVVNFRAGTYDVAQIRTLSAHEGSEANRVVFTNYRDENVLFRGGPIRIDRRYWTVSGINGETDNILFWVGEEGNGDNFIIENGTFRLTAFGGAANRGPIQFQTAGSYNGIVRNNRFIGPGASGNANTAGLYVWRSRNIKILNNEFSGFPSALFYKHPGVGFDTGIEIAYNYFHDNGIGVRTASIFANIHDNLFVDSSLRVGEAGGAGDDGPNHGGDFNTINHNTFYSGKIELQGLSESEGWGATNNIVTNNILTVRTEISPYRNNSHNTSIDSNIYPLGLSAILNNRVEYLLDKWKSFYGQDANSMTGNVVFVGGSSPATIGGFALTAGSPGKGAASDGKDMGADVSLVGIMGSAQNVGESGNGDSTAPVISSISATTGQSDATITATTNEPADFQVEYGKTTSYGNTTSLNPNLVTAHSALLTGLSTGTIYHYRVKSRDAAGNLAMSGDKTFATAGAGSVSSTECTNWRSAHPEWIWCDDFESGNISVGQGQYFDHDNNGGNFIPVNGVGFGNSYGMRARWQPGQVSAGTLHLNFGRNPIGDRGIRNTENFRDIYYRVFVRTQADWVGNPAKLSRATAFARSDWSQAMIAHLWGSDGGLLTLATDPVGCVDGSGNVACSGWNNFANMRWLGQKRGGTSLYATANADKWYCIESHVKLNDPGKSNGVQEFWIDGQFEAGSSNLNFVGTYTDFGINSIFLENHWNTGSPQLQERYLDNFVVSTQPIGCTPQAGLSPPSPPRIISVQ